MFKKVFLVVVIFIVGVFADPCSDSLFAELSKKGINELSQNELTYFLHQKDLCENVPSLGISAEQAKKEKGMKAFLIAVGSTVLATSILNVIFSVNSLTSK